MSRQQMVGRWGEEIAADYLISKGLEIIGRNVYTPYGELDIIARSNEITVIVEVKTRTSDSFGLPEEAVTPRKAQHLMDAALTFLQEHPEYDGDWRIDVISIQGSPEKNNMKVDWFENAIS